MQYNNKISQLIRQRHSCRTYQSRPLGRGDRVALETFLEKISAGPLGNPVRYQIIAAGEDDASRLKGLGTYGFIKDPAAFIVGIIRDNPGALEDFGYLTELLIIKAADLEIGTCWLGGTFTKSTFARRAGLEPDEIIPAVISLGYPANHQAFLDRVARVYAGADRRKPWYELFFDNFWDVPLTRENADDFLEALILTRLAPSASNKQPWRILKSGLLWHFYLKRTPSYPPPIFNWLLGLADLQRIDMGIAMSHFEYGLKESRQAGSWSVSDPQLTVPVSNLEYVASWVPDQLTASKR